LQQKRAFTTSPASSHMKLGRRKKIENSLYVTKEIKRERIKGEKRKSKRKEEKLENWERAERQREKKMF